jgi:CHAT domain-containing protein
MDNLRECYYQKGIILERKGDISGAQDNYKHSVKLLESLREDISGGKEEQIVFVEKRSSVYQKLITLLMKQGKSAEALEYLERSRLQNLRNQFDLLNPNLNNEKEEAAKEKEKKLREQIEDARTQLVEERSKPKDEQNIEKIARLEDRLKVKKQEYIEYINDLREKFPELASLLAIQPDSLVDLQGLLPPNVALIQYLILPENLYIFVVTDSTLFHKEVAVKQTDIESKIDYFRSMLMNPQIPMNLGPLDTATMTPSEPDRSHFFEMFVKPLIEVSNEIYGLLIKPVEKELAKYSVLGIIPNGKLHLLPFQALGEKDLKGGFRFLLEKKAIFQLNSQSVLKFAQKRASEIGDKANILAFGNPDNSLQHAEEEIRMIKEIFSKSKAYVGKNATEDKVKKELSGFNILHLATHGKIMDDIKESHVLFAPSFDGKEDGKLLIKEIWGLPLTGYQLVTLSACDTALGKEASGDVMVSLETAFLRAGTPTIVASLWEVDDQATGVLMKSFYQNLKTQGKAEALRNAQTSLMKDPRYIYPYFWAPFVLVGDWR